MDLPKAKISKEEALELWIDEHSDYAKEQMVLSNIGLIAFVMKSIGLDVNDEDLFSTGILALVRSVNSYDAKKRTKFSSYAVKAIKNEFLIMLRKKMVVISFSIDEIRTNDNGDTICFSEKTPSNVNVEEEVAVRHDIQRAIRKLSEREKKIIDICFFQAKTQREAQVEMNLSHTSITNALRDAYRKCREELT